MGSGGKSKQQPVPTISAPSFNTDPSLYRNLGYQQTPNTYTSQGKPAWMQGYFDDPMWGRAAADPRVQLTHEMLGPTGAGAVNQAVYGGAPPELMQQALAQAQPQPQQGGSLAQAGGGMPYGAVPPSMNPKSRQLSQMMGGMAQQGLPYRQSYPDMGQQFPTSGQGG